MTPIPAFCRFFAVGFGLAVSIAAAEPPILTPPPPKAPWINGPGVFGARPGSPFLYTIPATGVRPMRFSADGLPAGLAVDPANGRITGSVPARGSYPVVLHAMNALGVADRKFVIEVGDTICLTPPMGWNSWNHYAGRVTQAIVLENARAMASSGLIDHGWTYVNIDDTWQGVRGGPYGAIHGNEKFPDMKGLCDAVHALGLKIGIYSTPWEQSYAGHIGGSADNPQGRWTKAEKQKGRLNRNIAPWAVGRYSFAENDARQWAAWGFDYLKYDWNPNEAPETGDMFRALCRSGRDVVYSLSNSTPYWNVPRLSRMADCWRISGDIKANWASMTREALADDKWAAYARPGHWNDPDMLEIATRERNQPGLTPEEEYTHMSFWCLLSAPLLLGNDLTKMDAFTLGLLENDEVLAVDQDALGRQAVRVAQEGDAMVYAKPLEDGSWAVGLFNLGGGPAEVTARWRDLGARGALLVRDLWRQKDLGVFEGEFAARVAPHGVVLVRVGEPPRAAAPALPQASLPGFDLGAYERPRVVREADAALAVEPKTIVAAVNPRSAGGPHDWSSEGDYWWPNPKDPNGPYVQRDGMTNPANFVAHRELMLRFVRAFGALAAAYKLTGDPRYAAAAVRHLNAWFVDPATRMNPNLQYAQAIHGVTTGRSIGVIDTVHLAEVALGVEALRGSPAFGPAEDAAVTRWFRDYLHWLRTSPNGTGESRAPNNHGTCWVLQEAAFAHLAGDREALADARRRFEEILLPRQMAPDGSFPRELRRTKPYGYSIFNLDVMTALAQVLSTPSDNLMTHALPDGRSLVRGVEFLAPYLADKQAWLRRVRRPSSVRPEAARADDPLEKPDVMYGNDWPVRQPCLLFGALAAGREDWLDLWKRLDPDPKVEEIRRNFPIRQPVLWIGLRSP